MKIAAFYWFSGNCQESAACAIIALVNKRLFVRPRFHWSICLVFDFSVPYFSLRRRALAITEKELSDIVRLAIIGLSLMPHKGMSKPAAIGTARLL